jgi:hypothetical protein
MADQIFNSYHRLAGADNRRGFLLYFGWTHNQTLYLNVIE